MLQCSIGAQVGGLRQRLGGLQRDQAVELGADIGHASGDHYAAGRAARPLCVDHADHAQRARRGPSGGRRTGRALAQRAARANPDVGAGPGGHRLARAEPGHPAVGQRLQRRPKVKAMLSERFFL